MDDTFVTFIGQILVKNGGNICLFWLNTVPKSKTSLLLIDNTTQLGIPGILYQVLYTSIRVPGTIPGTGTVVLVPGKVFGFWFSEVFKKFILLVIL
jgi:hypothetical protein